MATPLTAIPSATAAALPFGHHLIAQGLIYEEPATPPGVQPHAAIRLGDSASLDGAGHGILNTSYQLSKCGIVQVAGDNVRVENLSFSNARYGIVTPFAYDADFNRGRHVFRNINGSAYDRIFRVAGHSTLLECFRFCKAGGSLAQPETMGFGAEFLGPNPTVRHGVITMLSYVDLPDGPLVAEGVGLSFSSCDGALAEYVKIGNSGVEPLSHTIGVWIGGESRNVLLRNVAVSNLQVAFLASTGSYGVLEDCWSIGCDVGFAGLLSSCWKLKNCHDVRMIDGVWTVVDVNSEP